MFLVDDIFKLFKGSGPKVAAGDYLARQGAQIAASLQLPLLICDKKFSIIGANAAFTRLFRISKNQLQDKKLTQIIGTDVSLAKENGQARKVLHLSSLLVGRNPKLLIGNFPKIGKRAFHLFTRTVTTKEGKDLLFIFQDVTDAQEQENRISKSRRELLEVFDGVDDPTVMIDRDFKVRRINRSMLEVLDGSSYQGFLGKTCYYTLHGRTDACPGCTADKTFRNGKKTSRIGPLAKRSSTDDFIYQITYHPIKDTSGKVTAIAESYRDVTEVKRIQEELYESERSRIMEPLAAGVAHEVRNPLAIIQSTAQYCLKAIDYNDDLVESMHTIIKNTETANRVIGDLLDFAKPQAVDFKRQPLRPLLEEGLRLIKGRAHNHKVQVSKSIPRNLPRLLLDQKRFLQAYVNLLVNALDAMPEGGKLNVEAHRRDRDHTAVVMVRDTGGGIPEEVVAKAFQPFYSTKKNGVGLGLPIAEGIIRSHGGQVHFKSLEGEGTEVTIVLPLIMIGRNRS